MPITAAQFHAIIHALCAQMGFNPPLLAPPRNPTQRYWRIQNLNLGGIPLGIEIIANQRNFAICLILPNQKPISKACLDPFVQALIACLNRHLASLTRLPQLEA